ncbi:hypothetical protein [Paracoccus sp. (in: a-proteobacteria)]|uniref:hypothetical protein n=1 Tax=Paracoccus sp. TaxID=267 RepID=UPI002896EB19|nr:hypothetical protein [Paracoccus sp. (in: a-proteobacteria)]
MANEDPAGIPDQIRQNRPFMLVLALALLIAVGTFLFILWQDPNENDLERTSPPAELVTPPAAEAPAATTTAPATPAPETPAPATTAPAATEPAATSAPAAPATTPAPAAPATSN